MPDKMGKIFVSIIRLIDFPVAAICFLLCLIVSLFRIPWILAQRRVWVQNVKGSPKALILRGFSLDKQKRRGFAHLLSFQNPSLEWAGILDSTNATQATIQISDHLFLVALQSPPILTAIGKIGLRGTAIILRELVAVLKLTSYCIQQKIGVLRAYKHNFAALQAYLVSRCLTIPFIVDISGNYELIRRLTGKTFYFKTLSKIPIIGILGRLGANWLLGLPLRHAHRVLGRNKNNYEHAFALGAPVERLSLLRISNFSQAFINYDPQTLPPKPATYPYLLFVGRLAEINFPLDTIAAFEKSASQLPEYRLVIIGDGAIKDRVEGRRNHSEFKDRIELLGTRSTDTVFNWTAHADLALCPYSGSTLVEAMLCNTPVIAYDIEGHSEIVMDNYTGYLVPFRDTDALAAKIIQVVQHYEAAGKIAQRGRELARVVFDQVSICEKESIFYRQALEHYESNHTGLSS